MILIDANLLLYAYGSASEHHAQSRAWLDQRLAEPEPIRLAWVTILTFVRLITDPRVFENALSMAQAVSIVSEWLAHPALGVLEPGERHWAILADLLPKTQARGSLVVDAHLAALAIEHGAILCTNDKDFTRFPGLRVEFPLEAPQP